MPLLPRTFRNQMAWLFGCLVAAVGLPGYVYISHFYADQLLADRQSALQGLATSVATVMAQNLVERKREIDLLAQSDTLRTAPLDHPRVLQALERLQHAYPGYPWIGVTDAPGVVRSATQHLLVGVDTSQRPWFGHGQKAPYVGDVHEAQLLAQLLPAPVSDQPLRFIDFAAPIVGLDGRLRGVLAAHAHWQWAGDVLTLATPDDARQAGVEVLVVNHQNQVIHPERMAANLQVPVLDRPATASGRPPFHTWGGTGSYLTAAAAVPEPVPAMPLGWQVVVRQPASLVLAGVHTLQKGVLLVSLGAGLVLLVLGWLAAGRVAQPVEQLTRLAREVQHGAENVVFEVPTRSLELQHLSAALGGMARTLLKHQHALEHHNRVLEARVSERTAELERLNHTLQQQARTDSLTGLANRLAADEQLRQAHAVFKRNQKPYTVLLMDVDHFKRVNDTHGHAAGDDVLRHVASVLQEHLRETDLVARVGGEEFLVLLHQTPLDQALVVADKLRVAVASTPISPVGAVTVSLGAAEVQAADTNPEATVNRADQALYVAKQAGRNRVSAAA